MSPLCAVRDCGSAGSLPSSGTQFVPRQSLGSLESAVSLAELLIPAASSTASHCASSQPGSATKPAHHDEAAQQEAAPTTSRSAAGGYTHDQRVPCAPTGKRWLLPWAAAGFDADRCGAAGDSEDDDADSLAVKRQCASRTWAVQVWPEPPLRAEA